MRSRFCCATAATSNRSRPWAPAVQEMGRNSGAMDWAMEFQGGILSVRQTGFEASIQMQGSNSGIPRHKGRCQGERDGALSSSHAARSVQGQSHASLLKTGLWVVEEQLPLDNHLGGGG